MGNKLRTGPCRQFHCIVSLKSATIVGIIDTIESLQKNKKQLASRRKRYLPRGRKVSGLYIFTSTVMENYDP